METTETLRTRSTAALWLWTVVMLAPGCGRSAGRAEPGAHASLGASPGAIDSAGGSALAGADAASALDLARTNDARLATGRSHEHASRELMALVDQIANRVASVRHLAILRPIQRGVLDRDEIVARLRTRVRHEYPPGEIELEAQVYRLLGMIPEAMNYEATVFDLLEEQVAGFYDPDARQLFIASWLGAELQTPTLAHEIDHALQDQHFDIARFTHHVRGMGDAQTAAMAVIEGDATAAMLEFMLSSSGRSIQQHDPNLEGDSMFSDTSTAASSQRLRRAPHALREMLMFPYRAGLELCLRAYRARGNWTDVDALLRTPPPSTEQVLHADKLRTHEPPIAVPASVPASLSPNFVVAYDDVLGELGLRLALEPNFPRPISSEAAAGWGGDRVVLLEPRGAAPAAALAQSVLVWTIEFDPGPRAAPDREAIEFERAGAQTLASRHARGIARSVPRFTRVIETSPGRVAAIARAGRRVWIIENAPLEAVERWVF